jgi:hypothetical protein
MLTVKFLQDLLKIVSQSGTVVNPPQFISIAPANHLLKFPLEKNVYQNSIQKY